MHSTSLGRVLSLLILINGVLLVTQLATSPRPLPSTVKKPAIKKINDYKMIGPKNFWSEFAARTPTGHIQVVVEIPSGTNQKWQVSKADGGLEWEFKRGRPRVVQYLSYPGNYGMIPQTLLPAEEGGDGDPLDVLVLGPAQPRGAVIPARLIGVLHLQDGGERDDKLIAVPLKGPLSDLTSLATLKPRYPGVAQLIKLWFTHYKGSGDIVTTGYGNHEAALKLLDRAMVAYKKKFPRATSP